MLAATSVSVVAQPGAEGAIDDLWQAALEANPDIAPTEGFYRAYAAEVLPALRDFVGYIEVLKHPDSYACDRNLLCREGHFIAGFRLGEKPTAIDFVRYVRTSTCYGFLPDKEGQTRFLTQLETALVKSGVEPATLLPSGADAGQLASHFVRYELANARDGQGELIVQTGRRRFSKISELLRQAGVRRGPHRPPGSPLDPLIRDKAYETCKRAYGPPPFKR